MATGAPTAEIVPERAPLLPHDVSRLPGVNTSGSAPQEGGLAAGQQWAPVVTVDDAVDSLGVGLFQWIMFVLVGMAIMGEAAKQTVVAFIAPVVKCEMGLSKREESLMIILNFAGMVLGSYAWGSLADVAGRKFTFFAITIASALSSLLAAIMPSIPFLIFFLMGLGFTAFSNILGETFLVEYLPANRRGFWCMLVNLFWGIGIISAATCAWTVTPQGGWRAFLVLTSVPYFVILALWPLIPESAHFLIVMNRPRQAKKALLWVSKLNRRTMPTGELFVPPRHHHKDESQSIISKIKDIIYEDESLVSRSLRVTTLGVMTIWTMVGMCYFALFLMTTEIHAVNSHESGTCQNRAFKFSDGDYFRLLIVSLSEIIGNIIPLLFVEWAGRKRSMQICFVGACFGLLPIFIAPNADAMWSLFSSRALLQSLVVLIILYTPEIYPTEMRTSASGIGNMLASLASLISPIVAQVLLHSSGLRSSAGVLLGCCVIGLFGASILPMDTRGRPLTDVIEEIEHDYDERHAHNQETTREV